MLHKGSWMQNCRPHEQYKHTHTHTLTPEALDLFMRCGISGMQSVKQGRPRREVSAQFLFFLSGMQRSACLLRDAWFHSVDSILREFKIQDVFVSRVQILGRQRQRTTVRNQTFHAMIRS